MIKSFITIFTLMSTVVFSQQTTNSYLFFNENRSLTAARNWVIRQNNTHEGDFQIGCTSTNTGTLPDFNTVPILSKLTISSSGNVGIGTTNPDFRLTVNGNIKCEEVVVVVDVPADYVFDLDYKLMPLSEVGKYIKENKHLPNVPSAKEIKQNGWHVGEMNNKLLEKVEELTLYLLQLKDENEALKARVEALESQKR